MFNRVDREIVSEIVSKISSKISIDWYLLFSGLFPKIVGRRPKTYQKLKLHQTLRLKGGLIAPVLSFVRKGKVMLFSIPQLIYFVSARKECQQTVLECVRTEYAA